MQHDVASDGAGVRLPRASGSAPPSVGAASCPNCSARFEHLRLADSRGRPRELRCTGCGATFYAATCPACHIFSTHLELAPRRRRYEHRTAGASVVRAVRCSDCAHVWLLARQADLRDLAAPAYWRMRLGLDAPRPLEQERSDLGKLLLRGFASVIIVMPMVGFALAALFMLLVPLFGVALAARDLWAAHPFAATGLILLAVAVVVALYALARRRLVDSAPARGFVRAMHGPVPLAAIAVVLFVYGVWSAG